MGSTAVVEIMWAADGPRHTARLRIRKPLGMRPRLEHVTITVFQMRKDIRRLLTFMPTASGLAMTLAVVTPTIIWIIRLNTDIFPAGLDAAISGI